MGQNLISSNPSQPVILVFLCIILYSFLITTEGLTIKLVRRDKFDTDLFHENLSDVEKHKIYADLSLSRALRFTEQASSLTNSTDPSFDQSIRIPAMKADQLRPTLTKIFDSIFAVQVTIGSRQHPAYLAMDTGSDFTWVQCTACRGCFRIRDGPFNPGESSTYRDVLYGHRRCGRRGRLGGPGERCRFEVRYMESGVEGTTANETVRFMTAPHSYVTIKDFALGCADSAHGFESVSRLDNRFAGMFGIAWRGRPDSFMVFTEDTTKLIFSYCLPPWNAGLLVTSLLFGDDVVQPLPESAKTIPMYVSPHYRVHCLDISVGGERLDQRLWPRDDGTGGLILDTGTAINYLEDEAYEKVRRAFIRNLTSLNVRPDAQPLDPYKLCYSSPLPRGVQLPWLSLHFVGGHELKIEFWNAFQNVKLPDRSEKVCMMILPSPDKTSTLGAVSMANYRFVHNVRRRTLSFYPEICRGN